jgi:long-subunit fatty acid transport protein
MWKLNDKLDIGLTANVPFSITISGEAENRFYMPKNNTLWQEITYAGTVEHLFLSGQVVNVKSDYEASLDLPMSLGIGFKYQATEKLMLTLDADYTMWSSYEGLQFEYSNFQGLIGPADTSALAREMFTTNLEAPVEWENTINLMMGAAYDYSNVFTFLGGVGFDQSPSRDSEMITPQFIDNGNKTNISLGVIAHIDRWDLSLVSTYQNQPDLSVENMDGYDVDGTVQRFPGEYKAETYETIFSFNYRF